MRAQTTTHTHTHTHRSLSATAKACHERLRLRKQYGRFLKYGWAVAASTAGPNEPDHTNSTLVIFSRAPSQCDSTAPCPQRYLARITCCQGGCWQHIRCRLDCTHCGVEVGAKPCRARGKPPQRHVLHY